jgi:hypothetical protein
METPARRVFADGAFVARLIPGLAQQVTRHPRWLAGSRIAAPGITALTPMTPIITVWT